MKRLAFALALTAAGSADAETLAYFHDFENASIGPQWSGAAALEPTGGLSAFGFGALHLHNGGSAASTLDLLGLGSHTTITLSFDLAMWDSIDHGGDQFVVIAGGTTLYNSSTDFGNYFPADGVSHGPGTLLTEPFNAVFNFPDYGQSGSFRDSGRAVSFTFPHTGESISISFQYPNTQGAPDESFGLDNVRVILDPIPEPSSLALVLASTVMVARRRRR